MKLIICSSNTPLMTMFGIHTSVFYLLFTKFTGEMNPLLEKSYMDLTLHQRVWILKCLCDNSLVREIISVVWFISSIVTAVPTLNSVTQATKTHLFFDILLISVEHFL